MMTAQPRRGDLVVEARPPNIAKLRQERHRVGQETLGAGHSAWIPMPAPPGVLGFLRGRVPQRFRSYGAWRKFGGTGYKDAAPTALTALTADAIGDVGAEICQPLRGDLFVCCHSVRRNGPRSHAKWVRGRTTEGFCATNPSLHFLPQA